MAAVYPTSVKTFTTRTDAVDTVFASNINDLQAEVASLEATVGTAPTTFAGYTPYLSVGIGRTSVPPVANIGAAVTYSSVAARLDTLQKQTAWLSSLMQPSGTVLTPPAAYPITTIRCPGQTFAAGFGVFAPYLWTAADYDPYGMLGGGSDIACPATGWWQISASIWSDIPPVTGTHHANVRLIVAGIEKATQGSPVQVGVAAQHRMNLVWSGKWSAGETMNLQFGHNPADPSGAGVNSRSSISLSYLRPTV